MQVMQVMSNNHQKHRHRKSFQLILRHHNQLSLNNQTLLQHHPHDMARARESPLTWHRDYDVQLNTVKINSPPVVHSSPSVDSGREAEWGFLIETEILCICKCYTFASVAKILIVPETNWVQL
ncbi:unnamed protein product [Cuscuta europaea]|uniref:Uncharacterized protein n=1 Tax=Cuscuta europaea TaxID=41803 RepID=A0A9P1E5J7_CUSEU|nr:unnamed protein product [Cuscuta europaea]